MKTKSTYKTYADQYTKWCVKQSQDPLKAESLCDFIRDGLEVRNLSRSTLTSVIPSAVEDLFKFHNTSPTRDSPKLVSAMKKCIRRLTKPSVPKLPVLRKHLEAMANIAKLNLKETRDILILVLMFAGLLRESEVVALLANDVWVVKAEKSDTMVLYMVVRKSKTDQYSENATVVVSGYPGSPICPVMLYFRYMALRRNSKLFFHQVPKESLEPLATTSPCHIIKAWLKRINVDPTGYGSHSLRRGGATAAAAALVRFHVLKRHGRWKSDTVYLYIVDGPEEQLGVSQAVLGSFV